MPETNETADLLEQVSGGDGAASNDGDQARPQDTSAIAYCQEHLSDAHRAMLLDESAISPEVVAARGYRTVTSPADLADLGFAPSQRKVPGLLLPLHPTDGGEPPLCVYRPDRPRELRDRRTGKARVLKYEVPKGAGTRLDCPPVCQPMLADPAVPLWVTEGIKKADALASRGLCAIALLGVWNWRGRNDFGGVVVLADFDFVALNGRDVRLVFDSDVMVKPQVRAALDRLTAVLQRKGAHVAAVYLPHGKDGKTGVDDYLAAGHTVEELEALVEAPRPELKAAAPTVELLEAPPEAMRRPMALVGGKGYLATSLWVKETHTEMLDKRTGEVVRLEEPVVKTGPRLFVLSDDGQVYGAGGDHPLEELGFEVDLPDLPRNGALLSTAGVRRYRAGERPEAADVVARVARVYDRYIDFTSSLGDQATMCRFMACLSLSTYFLPAWSVVGYPWLTGEKGSGKTQAGMVWALTSYLGAMVLSSGSFAALRDLAEAGAALCYDDAEVLSDPRKCDPDKRELALAGYRRGSQVPLKEKDPDGDRWVTRWVNAFAPRAFTAIASPDNVLASRCIVVPLVRTADPRRANADPGNTDRWPVDRRALIDDSWALALALLVEAETVWDELERDVAYTGRDFEPWRAVVATARLLDRHGAQGLEEDVRAVMRRYFAERADILGDDWTVAVVRALVGYAEEHLDDAAAQGRLVGHMDTLDTSDTCMGEWTLSASQVSETIKSAGGQDDEEGAAWATPTRVGKILAHLRLRAVRKSNKRRARGWGFTLDDARRLALAFHVDTPLLQMDTCADTSAHPSHTSVRSVQSVHVSDADAGNGHHGPVDPAHDVAPYGAYRRAMEARGQEPLSVPEWAQAGRPKGPAGDDGEWEEIAPDAPQEPGGVFRMDLATGKSYRRAGGAI